MWPVCTFPTHFCPPGSPPLGDSSSAGVTEVPRHGRRAARRGPGRRGVTTRPRALTQGRPFLAWTPYRTTSRRLNRFLSRRRGNGRERQVALARACPAGGGV